MVQQVFLPDKPGNLRLIPEVHVKVVEGPTSTTLSSDLHNIVLWPPTHAPLYVLIYPHTLMIVITTTAAINNMLKKESWYVLSDPDTRSPPSL